MTAHCPQHDTVSAYVDGELDPAERTTFAAHLQGCPTCSLLLRELRALHDEFQALPDLAPGFDLGALIDERLNERSKPRPASPMPHRLVPAALAGALATLGSLAGGFVLGLSIAVAPARLPPATPAAMAVFDAVPPGGICLAAASCPTQGARR